MTTIFPFKIGLLLLAPFLLGAALDLEILLDCSASMGQQHGATSRLAAAKELALDLQRNLTAEDRLSLRVFGHRQPAVDRDLSCADTELLLPLGAYGPKQIETVLDGLKARGRTPLAYALQQVPADFADSGSRRRMVALITDGRESCGADPAAAIKELRQLGLDVRVNIIGLKLDEPGKQELRRLAGLGGGIFVAVDDLRHLPNLAAKLLGSPPPVVPEALNLKPGSYHFDWPDTQVAEVLFSFQGLTGEKYALSISTTAQRRESLVVQVRDPGGALVLEEQLAQNADLSGAVLLLPQDGSYQLRLAAKGRAPTSFAYKLDLSQIVGY